MSRKCEKCKRNDAAPGERLCLSCQLKEEQDREYGEIMKAQGMVEYALILALVAVIVIVALTAMGPLITNIFETINAVL